MSETETPAALEWWQRLLVERLPEYATVRFADDGGETVAAFGPWRLSRGWGNRWIDLYGPGIHDRLSIHSPSFAGQWDKALGVLALLGAPLRPGSTFRTASPLRAQAAS